MERFISTASSSLSTANTTDNNARLSDAIVYAFLANQPNGSQVVHEDLEKIHEDDLEEMDLKWQLALLKCFNCHKMGQFARECKNPRSQEYRSRNQDSSRKTVNVEEYSSKAMLAIDGVRFDWSFMTEEKTPTNFALMAFSDSEVHNNKTCTKSCLKSFEDLKSQYDNLRIELNKSKFDLANYKRCLASVEEQLVFYNKNEGYGVKVNKSISENSSNEIKKTSDTPIIEDWISDCDEDETLEKVSESANVQKPKQGDQPRKISQNPRNNRTNRNTPMSKKLGVGFQFTSKACFVCGSFNHLIKDCDFHDKKMVQKPILNNVKKGTGQREVRPVWNNAMRTNHQNFSNSRRNFAPTVVLTKSGLVQISTTRQSSSRAAAPVSTVRPIKTDAPKSFVNETRPNAFQKLHSPSRRPFYQQTALKNRNLNNKVNTVKVNSVNTAKGKRVTSDVGEQGINAVKSKACWVWRPKIKVLDHVSKNSESYICKQFDYVDPIGLEFKDKKELAIPGQTTTGKEFSNPLMADRKLKEVGTLRYLNLVVPLTKVDDEAIHKELGDKMEKAATTASSFKSEQDSGSGPGGYKPGSDEGRKKLNELMELCIKLSKKRSAQVNNKEEKGKVKLKFLQMLPEKRLSKATPEEERRFKKILKIRVRDVTVAYQSFEDMVKGFDREDLVALWSLYKGRFRSAEFTEDMEKALWVELKRLFEPDKDDVLWKLQRYIHCQLQLWH
ncbi:ribonuclease H-like domain-containing protein [Tanacetum coccineum]